MSKAGIPLTAIESFDAGAEAYENSTGRCTRELAHALVGLPHLQSMFLSGSIVLDNACGTAVVTEEIITNCQQRNIAFPHVRAVDPAKAMVRVAQAKLRALGLGDCCTSTIMHGEKLIFEDNFFTHSITNLGMPFFIDGIAGASEIYRTLKPGGTAIVTSWEDVQCMTSIIQSAQRVVRPEDQPFGMPMPKIWMEPSHVVQVLMSGGFKSVEVLERVVYYGAESLCELQRMLLDSFRTPLRDWSSEEVISFKMALAEALVKYTEKFNMCTGKPGLGIRMRAIIAICLK
jgi:ubiquinone/menaquinone biosynthesis C-methylase UbiE